MTDPQNFAAAALDIASDNILQLTSEAHQYAANLSTSEDQLAAQVILNDMLDLLNADESSGVGAAFNDLPSPVDGYPELSRVRNIFDAVTSFHEHADLYSVVHDCVAENEATFEPECIADITRKMKSDYQAFDYSVGRATAVTACIIGAYLLSNETIH